MYYTLLLLNSFLYGDVIAPFYHASSEHLIFANVTMGLSFIISQLFGFLFYSKKLNIDDLSDMGYNLIIFPGILFNIMTYNENISYIHDLSPNKLLLTSFVLMNFNKIVSMLYVYNHKNYLENSLDEDIDSDGTLSDKETPNNTPTKDTPTDIDKMDDVKEVVKAEEDKLKSYFW